MGKTIKRDITIFFCCLILNYIAYYCFLNDLIVKIIRGGMIIQLSGLLSTTLSLFVVIRFILFKEINKTHIDILALFYMICVIALTFGKGSYSRINMNPLFIISEFRTNFYHTLLFLILNVLLYIPCVFYLRARVKLSNIKLCKYFVIYIILIEISQHMLSLGVMDINDIIVNTISFMLGLRIYILIQSKKNFKVLD